MNLRCILWMALGLACSCLPQPDAAGQDWPQWGGSDSKNMVAEELQVLPSDAANGRPVVDGDFLYVSTSNSVDRGPNEPDQSHHKTPFPDAPNVIALDKKTGRLLARDEAPIASARLTSRPVLIACAYDD